MQNGAGITAAAGGMREDHSIAFLKWLAHPIGDNAFPHGHDLAYHFIPNNEIWIDGQITCEETEYSIAQELKERELMAKGFDYDSAYIEAVKISDKMRSDQQSKCNAHPLIAKPDQILRDTGVILP